MADAMYQNDGVGLAAPQIGLPLRMVVIDCQDDHGLIELINPVITYQEGSMTGSEGCLSVPGIYGEVERYAKVKVEFLNRRGKKQHITATGLLARCIQHELDHLEGQLFIDIAQSIHRGNQA
jgi:peptide deformylase